MERESALPPLAAPVSVNNHLPANTRARDACAGSTKLTGG